MLRKFILIICLVCIHAFGVLGCQSLNKSDVKDVSQTEFDIKLVPHRGRVDRQKFVSHITRQDYEDGQLVRDKNQSVDFEIQSTDMSLNENIQLLVETIKKTGTVSLNSMALPEEGESIKYVYTPKGEVIKVDGKPEGTLWYLSPFPIPEKLVRMGDSWVSKEQWVDAQSGLVLELELVGILKRAFSCFEKDTCLEIEISGGVNLPEEVKKNMRYQSKMQGRILFNMTNSAILWSSYQSGDDIVMGDKRSKNRSCTMSYQVFPEQESIEKLITDKSCDPAKESSKKNPFL
ncbi:MAG: hypothetical protein KDD50_01690 [Bdellovibrionales bacterium]|nr:hypothetical protein [Bdellovibrionales bacterium]